MIRYIEELAKSKIISEQELITQIGDMIEKRKETGKRTVVALDGMCAAGKSTLAAKLAERFGGSSIAIDDFHLPFDMRTGERRAEPGGNMHYERFSQEVAAYLRNGETFSYGRFSCRDGKVTETKTVAADCPLVVIEGAYAMQPEFRDIYDLSVCVLVSDGLQKERLLAREGEEKYKNFETMWMPMEHKYLTYYNIPSICDAVMIAGE